MDSYLDKIKYDFLVKKNTKLQPIITAVNVLVLTFIKFVLKEKLPESKLTVFSNRCRERIKSEITTTPQMHIKNHVIEFKIEEAIYMLYFKGERAPIFLFPLIEYKEKIQKQLEVYAIPKLITNGLKVGIINIENLSFYKFSKIFAEICAPDECLIDAGFQLSAEYFANNKFDDVCEIMEFIQKLKSKWRRCKSLALL